MPACHAHACTPALPALPLAGVALGVSPAGPLLCDASAAAAFVAAHAHSSFAAWELSLLLGVLRCCWETVELLATGTLPMQALVLAASLFGPQAAAAGSSNGGAAGGRQGGGQAAAAQGTVEVESAGGVHVELEDDNGGGSTSSGEESLRDDGGGSDSGLGGSFGGQQQQQVGGGGGDGVSSGISITHAQARTADDASASVLQQLRPRGVWEWRTLAAVGTVRFLLLPALSCGLVLGTLRLGLLPPDPACAFMLLLQSCMPSAQNIVLMLQLQPSTAGLAPAAARLLLQLYALAVLPVTLWVSAFAKLVLQ